MTERSFLLCKHTLLIGLLTLIAACATPAIHTAQTAQPMLSVDTPASMSELTIVSHGKRLPGLIYQAAGDGPHPTALFLHGYPGNERSLDVAQAIRAKGWNAVYFNYRGAWGAEGEFSFLNAEQDVQSVINYLINPNNAKTLGIDPQRIALVGHSMGGHMAVAGLLDHAKVRCAISYDGANMGANGTGLFANEAARKLWHDYSDTLFMLNGWSGEKALNEIEQFGNQIDLTQRLATLGDRKILFIAADTDVVPMNVHISPLVEAIQAINPNQAELIVIKDDHAFSNNRDRIINETSRFLSNQCDS